MSSTAVRRGVCVFCGSRPGTDPSYAAAARELGTLLAEGKFDVVYGGSSDGCMGVLADAALARGGQVIGIAPPFLGLVERLHKGLTRFEPVRDLAERKLRMLTMKRMAMVRHPLIVIDVAGFFQPLDALLTHLIASGFMGETQRSLYQVVADPASALRVLEASL
jgi:predicted Rossmann-fold nucleotide-binding protein